MDNQAIGLGDIVSLQFSDGVYDTGTVCQVHRDGTVDVHRPYTHTADFSCAGDKMGSMQVICYIGIEIVKSVTPSRLKLLRKADPIR